MTCSVQITINYEANFSCLASLLVDELFCFRLTVDLKSEGEKEGKAAQLGEKRKEVELLN
jgi:hypothetical protein